MDSNEELERPRKRAKVSIQDRPTDRASPSSLTAPISPPRSKSTGPAEILGDGEGPAKRDVNVTPASASIPSPISLTTIRDLPISLNADTISLKQLLGDPMIAECWEFNYLHDLDYLMDAFDKDVRALVKVHVVHGFWKREDGAGMKEQALKYPNITLHAAYMPEMFGTHHTKMMVLLRHDDMAQIIIHTANMIHRDWTNMTQAIWRSPLLPLSHARTTPGTDPEFGSGQKFKIDFLSYLGAYDTKRRVCTDLIETLRKYDFSEIKGTLIGSVPGRHEIESQHQTLWGWPALRKALEVVPAKEGESEIVVQISSIATLGVTDQWLDRTLFKSLRGSKSGSDQPKPKFKVIFPTPDEIRRCLDGYRAGASIHTKIQSGPQVKQLQYLKPLLHHWAGDGAQHSSAPIISLQEAGRRRAAPHIKTYIRFNDSDQIDWALVTSANLSKQAWGEACNYAGEVRISSYELGVLVWPELFGKDAVMMPTFKMDKPVEIKDKVVVGFRMPYDLPVTKYAPSDMPWCATASYAEPDWRGETWKI